MQRPSLFLGLITIIPTFYEQSFGAQPVLAFKYMAKDMITQVHRESRQRINSCYVLAISYPTISNINNITVILKLIRQKDI